MADADRGGAGDEAARLETALERIARAAERAVPSADPEAEAQRAQRTAEVAARLDTLIAELREVLGPDEVPAPEAPASGDEAPLPGAMRAGAEASSEAGSSAVPRADRAPADPN